MDNASANIQTPARTITLFTATCIVIANMIGTGVFTSLGFQVRDLPSPFTIAVLWFVGGICALCGALVYGELAAALPRSGGEYHLLSRIVHPAIGFLAGWISITVGFAAPIALAAMAFGQYFSTAAPLLHPVVLSVLLVIAIAATHLFGNKISSAFQNASTVLKIALILVFVVAGACIPTPQNISFWPHPGDLSLLASPSFAVSLVYVMYAYTGWNATAYIAGEIRDPSRNIPLSILLGTAIVTVIYVVLNGIFLYVAPAADLAGKVEVAHAAAIHVFGAAGARIMSAFICIGLVASISAMTWIGPRVAATMGEDWRSLRLLAWKSKRGIPLAALALQTAAAVIMLVTSTFDTVLTYIQFGLSASSFLTVLGVFVLRWREPKLERPYRTWGYPVTPLIFLGVTLWMMIHILISKPMESLAGTATLLVGFIFYYFSKPGRSEDPMASQERRP